MEALLHKIDCNRKIIKESHEYSEKKFIDFFSEAKDLDYPVAFRVTTDINSSLGWFLS